MKLEKMNQVSVSEFFAKSKEEMYDMAVEMVEKYNRLVDICNDSAERIADLVIERDNLVERHKVYTSALNKDLADKADKIELLEKEIEGRKELYTALKKLMDTEYISIDDHNNIVNQSIDEHNNIVDQFNKEIERLNRYGANVDKVNHDLVTKVALLESENEELKKKNMDDFKRRDDYMTNQAKCICELEKKIKHQKENLDGINKTLEIRTKEKESLINVRNSQEKEIEAHESENARLTEKIIELKKERDKYMARVNDLRMELDCVKASKEKHEEAAHEKVVDDLRENIKYWRTKYLATQEERDAIHKELEELKKKEDDHGKSGFTEYIKYVIDKEEEKFKAELNKRFSEEVSKISQKRTEEALAKVKMNEKFGAKTVRCTKPNDFHCVYGDDCPVEAAEKCKFAKEENSIPCGEDAIE